MTVMDDSEAKDNREREARRGDYMTTWHYTRGLHDLDNDIYAYLQPDGTWGWSNAGLISGGEASLLIDTLFDLRLTGEMLDTIRRSLPAPTHIERCLA
jgi:hypothetical protein